MPVGHLLEVEGLRVHFPVRRGVLSRTVGYVYAVDGVSFHVAKGETLGIVGESGCGKTTMGMAVLRLIEPTAGRVTFEEVDLGRMSRAQAHDLRRRMQIIFQDPYSSLNPRMAVKNILGDPMRIHGLYSGRQCAERVAYLMEKVGLTPEQANRYPHQFSGGQRQRIGIARALALSPRLIIGDEPVSALDVSIRAQIINLLIDLQQEFALSYIIISHDLAIVEHICDRIAVMYLGKIVELASYKELYATPRHPYTQALMSAVPTTDPRTRKQRILLPGDVPNPIEPPAGCRFHPRCPQRFEPCARSEPPLREVALGHAAACFRLH
ncbi:MAG: dipeptide ABC transporter ATP-binding protein [Desulfobacterales bacterium]|jgi:oligopeptide/dipeptide ABC transporter ATP-binding protein|nr:dipeptide ABC transporter ATP-binding protein [Desulfobacterales bacterium]